MDTFPQATTETLAFRLPAHEKHLVHAAAAKHSELASDWLRRAIRHALGRDGLYEPVDDDA